MNSSLQKKKHPQYLSVRYLFQRWSSSCSSFLSSSWALPPLHDSSGPRQSSGWVCPPRGRQIWVLAKLASAIDITLFNAVAWCWSSAMLHHHIHPSWYPSRLNVSFWQANFVFILINCFDQQYHQFYWLTPRLILDSPFSPATQPMARMQATSAANPTLWYSSTSYSSSESVMMYSS